MASGKPTDQQTIEQILALFDAGYGRKQIQRELGIGRTTVSKYLSIHGRMRGRKTSSENIERMREMRRDGYEIKDIAIICDCSQPTASKYVRHIQREKTMRAIDQQTVDKIIALRDAGVSHPEISEQLMVSRASVSKYLKKSGRKMAGKGKPRIPDKTIERMIALHDEGNSVKAIAAKVGVCTTTVSTYLKMHGKTKNPIQPVTEEEIETMQRMRREGYTLDQIRLAVNRSPATIHGIVRDIPKPKAKPKQRVEKLHKVSKTSLPVRLHGEKLANSIDCGCKVCSATIRVEMPEHIDCSHIHSWAIHKTITCPECNTCFLVSDVISEADIELVMGYLKDRGPCYVGNDSAAISKTSL